ELFKDEVRSVGEILGLPREILYRHPFPGPGLAIRIIGEISEEKLTILKKVDNIFIKTLKETGWYDKVWQAFAVLMPVKTVGITGDKRSYGYVASLRAVDSVEGMTADWCKIPFEILDAVSSRITNEVEEITRVVYDISSKPPATIEWE
ncbi:MAG: GMP synthase, partial [Petrotoga mobilis]